MNSESNKKDIDYFTSKWDELADEMIAAGITSVVLGFNSDSKISSFNDDTFYGKVKKKLTKMIES